MKAVDTCSKHDKPVSLICTGCKELLCEKCLFEHCKLKHDFPMDLPTYASENVLPQYSKMLEKFDNQKSLIMTSSKEFLPEMSKLKEGLFVLKSQMENLLEQINKAIKAIGGYKYEPESLIRDAKEALLKDQKRLQEAIKNENRKYIIECLKVPEAINIPGIRDIDKKLIEGINKTVTQLIQSKELEKLIKDIGPLIECLKTTSTKFVYGNTSGSCDALYRYEIGTKKMCYCITIPKQAAVLQIGQQIFICGGYYNDYAVNTLSEFMETSQSLEAKAPMTYARYNLRLTSISPSNFVAIAGSDGSNYHPYCEEYSIYINKWTTLPSLKQSRIHPSVTMLNNAYLFVIGGADEKYIEKLDLKVKNEWMIIPIAQNECSIYYNPTSFAISSDEIMILEGGGIKYTGICNINTGAIKRHASTSLGDYYYYNSAIDIEGTIYIMGGYYGNIFVYYPSEKRFEMLEFSQIKA